MAKKKLQEEAIREGLAELSRSGVGVDNAGPALVPRLRQWGGGAKPAALAAVFLLGKIADISAVEALMELDHHVADKELRKEIKRSLFKLSQRGLMRAAERHEPSPATPLFSRAPDIEAYMSPVDGSGGRLVWIVRPQPNRGLYALQAMVNDRDGLERVGGAQMPRKQLRKTFEDIKEQHGITMIAVPWEYADGMVYQAFEAAKSRGRTGLENFHELRSVFSNRKPHDVAHPVERKFASVETREGAWRERSRLLLDEPELRFWILDSDWMQPFLPEIREAQTSRLVLNPAQKEERLAAIVRDAVKELCSGDKARVFRRRIEDMALYFSETGRPESARLAFAVALQIAEGDPGPLDIAFLTGLVQKSFAFYLSQEKSKEEEQPSLIIKP